MLEERIPDLSFPMVSLGKNETPWNLYPLLYRGGSREHIDKVAHLIECGALGAPIQERISLVLRIHEEMSAALVCGGSKHSLRKRIEITRTFFAWADESNQHLAIDTVEAAYLLWTDYELNRARVKKKLSEASAYYKAKMVGWAIDRALERPHRILASTRLTMPKRGTRVRGIQGDKQNLTESFKFGYFLLDICNGLTVAALWGELPLRIKLRSGQELVVWPLPKILTATNPVTSKERVASKRALKRREARENDRTLRTRSSLVNLRDRKSVV